MTTLYPIPWNPTLYLTRDTLDLLGRASELAGHDIECSEAWRTYLAQKGFWDARQAYLNGTGPYAPPASNPDDPNGQNNHRRAAAVDIVNMDDRPFMLAAGFTADPDEDWHFNNPNWRNMPIINDPAFAALAATPIPTGDEFEMATLDELRTIVAAGPNAASFLPLCVQNREPKAPPVPGIAIFSNGLVEAISREQWDAFGMAGCKQYYTTVSGHFAFLQDQAAKLRASYNTRQTVEFTPADLEAIAQRIAESKPDLDADAIADAVADELAQRIAAPTP